jgi:hypothetical protein
MLVDENPLAVEIHPRLDAAEAKDLKIFLGYKEQGVDRQGGVGGKMQPVYRLITALPINL